MRFTTFLAAFAGLDLITASPRPTGRTGSSAQALLKRGAHLVWVPRNAYDDQELRRRRWERTCDEALTKKGCVKGVIYRGERQLGQIDRLPRLYVNVEASSSMDMKNAKRMRVFEDGTSEEGWSKKDVRVVARTMRPKMVLPYQRNQKASISWDPHDAYAHYPKRKSFWDYRCDEALTREGCVAGTVYEGLMKRRRPDGSWLHYLNAEGSSTMDMENPKRLRVFEDGTSEEGWSSKDGTRRVMREMERRKKLKGTPPQKVQDALLFWDPPDTYTGQGYRKLHWEHRCAEALNRKGCDTGLIHKGTIQATRNGKKTSYIMVDGAPLTDLENSKRLRVYQDGSSEDFTESGWTPEDRRTMRKNKQVNYKLPGPPKNDPKHSVTWDPANAYERFPHMRRVYEEGCLEALKGEGCDFGIIHQGGRKSLNVTAGRHHGSSNETKHLRLFRNGSYELYPPVPAGEVPWSKGKSKSWAQGPLEASSEATKEGEQDEKCCQASKGQQRQQKSTRTQPQEASTNALAPTPAPAQATYSEWLQAPGRGEYQHSTTRQLETQLAYPGQFQRQGTGDSLYSGPAHVQHLEGAQDHTQDHHSKRRRIGGHDSK